MSVKIHQAKNKVFDLTEVKKLPYLVKKTPGLYILANNND